MRVLITGGTGFIGTALSLAHMADGHAVVVLAREATPAERENAEELRRAGAEVVLGSVTEDDKVVPALRGVDVVHHIAAAMREANIPDSAFWETNVHATERLLKASREAGVSRFVYCSSIGAFGKAPPKPATEETPCTPVDIYQKTKRAAEELCLRFRSETGYPISIVRPAEVYGPRDRRLLKLFKAVDSGRFVMIGPGTNHHHLIYIDDLVQGMRLAEERPEALGEICVLAGERSIDTAGLVRTVAGVLGKDAPRRKIPLGPVVAAAVACEAICRPLGIQPPIYPRRVDFFRSDFSFDISKAKRVLGFRPRFDLPEGLRLTAEAYRARGLM
jgi:nucleoside-diphosphate-sugar epimerase